MKHNIAGLIFGIFGVIFLAKDMGMHGNSLFGVSEMTWMWFTMAVVHFFLNDCECKNNATFL